MSLTNSQKDHIEETALKAFSGYSSRDLAHGFRIQTARGQVAAVYWGDLHAGNDVEIALADNRITQAYDVLTVQRWLQMERERSLQPCNVHKHGSDWPILGFSFEEALDFLKRCKALRIGFLPREVLAEVNARQSAETSKEKSANRLRAELAALRPVTQRAVIDLVRQAGIKVDRWYVRADGTKAATPRSNPAYCYNWAFGGNGEPSLACVWHSSLNIENGRIQMRSNVRELALRLERISKDSFKPSDQRDRARKQSARAKQLDELLSKAAKDNAPVRVIVNEGEVRAEADLGLESSVVRVRHLDPVTWRFSHYDNLSGEFVMHRDDIGSNESRLNPRIPDPMQERYVDQHDLAGTDTPDQKSATGTVRARDALVRNMVLERAAGHCEFCEAPGFRTRDGRLYAETHHVVPLSEDGADRVWNVVALCPNHHRQAHSGADAVEIRNQLQAMLTGMYPDRGN